MVKLTFNTLIALFLVMLIAGRDLPQDEQRAGTDTASDVQVVSADPGPGQLFEPLKISAGQTEEPVPAALITPVHSASRMPGPALQPSPEHRTAPAVTPAATNASLWRVTANSLNVRSGPSTGNAAVDRVTRGEEVLVVAENDGWVKIRIEGDGVEGWVARRFLTPAN